MNRAYAIPILAAVLLFTFLVPVATTRKLVYSAEVTPQRCDDTACLSSYEPLDQVCYVTLTHQIFGVGLVFCHYENVFS